MRKLAIILLILTSFSVGICQEKQLILDIKLEKNEFYILSGGTLISMGFSIKPLVVQNKIRPSYLYPGFSVPVAFGIGLTTTGLIRSIKPERKNKKYE